MTHDGASALLSLFVAFSIALMFTSIFAFRFRNERKPVVLAAYFLFFMALEWIGEHYFLKPGSLGVEVAVVCLVVAALFAGAAYLVGRYDPERRDSE